MYPTIFLLWVPDVLHDNLNLCLVALLSLWQVVSLTRLWQNPQWQNPQQAFRNNFVAEETSIYSRNFRFCGRNNVFCSRKKKINFIPKFCLLQQIKKKRFVICNSFCLLEPACSDFHYHYSKTKRIANHMYKFHHYSALRDKSL